MGCGKEIQFYSGHKQVMCGQSVSGRMIFCNLCLAKYKKQHPQGWRYYPGDLCPHGVYVGGCGADWMCGICESGEG